MTVFFSVNVYFFKDSTKLINRIKNNLKKKEFWSFFVKILKNNNFFFFFFLLFKLINFKLNKNLNLFELLLLLIFFVVVEKNFETLQKLKNWKKKFKWEKEEIIFNLDFVDCQLWDEIFLLASQAQQNRRRNDEEKRETDVFFSENIKITRQINISVSLLKS